MSARKFFLLIMALIIAGGTVMLARSIMNGAPGQGKSGQRGASQTEEVLVAARDLPAGTLIKETDLKWQPWPAEMAVSGYAVKSKNNISEYTGAVVRQGMRTGEPVMANRVVRKNEQGFMAAVLNPGMRAVSIPITPTGGVAGFVFPGDFVDVILTHELARKTDAEIGKGRKVSETVLENVRVLALDQNTDDQATEPKIAKTATLEVTPKQAETLVLVTQLGTLSLSLRSLASAVGESSDSGANANVIEPAIEAAEQAVSGKKAEESNVTWDSDVSSVLVKPANRRGAVQHIQIMRGKETTETVFELPQ